MVAIAGLTEAPSRTVPSQIDVEPRFVQVPTDRERSPEQAYETAFSSFVDPAIPAAPHDLEAQARVVGVLAALLHRFTQQSTIALDLFVRHSADIEKHLGFDAQLAGDLPLAEVVAQVRAALSAPEVDGPPEVRPPSNLAITFMEDPLTAPLVADVAAYGACHTTSYDIHFILPAARDCHRLVVGYNAQLFEAATIDRLVRGALALLHATTGDGQIAVESLPLIAEDDQRALRRSSGTALYPAEPIHRVFEARAKAKPQAVAATFQGRTLTYGELEERSNRLAQHLVSIGVGPEVPVAVCVRPSLDILVAVLAIFKARGIYLPLDPGHPAAFLSRMLEEAQPRLVLTHAALSALTQPDHFPQLCLDTEWDKVQSQPARPPEGEHRLEHPAYLLYTSGTTGKPKGVLATQGNLAHYIHVAQQKYGFCADDVFTSLARYTFSISLFDLLSPLACGGRVRLVERDEILAPERLIRVLQEVTVVHAGPSLLGGLFRYLRTTPGAPRSFPQLRHASTGGDLVPPSVMQEMKRVFENAEIYVIYGCTEISCMGTTFRVERDATPTRSWVGKAFPDTAVRVVDPQRQLVPFGVVGEICFAGKGIVRGYLQQPDLTAQKFIDLEGQRFYQTGDVGRMHADGNLEILGRRDFQVQLRGIRVELAGIENTVRELGLAAECAVVAKHLAIDDVRLVAFVVKPPDPSVTAFRKALGARLPDYMVPQHLVVLEAMPLTANGKLDRRQLQERPWESERGAPPPATKRADAGRHDPEQQIATVFARTLRVSVVGPDEDFFDLGGHSLLAVVAMQQVNKLLGLALPPQALFEDCTPRRLAARALEASAAQVRPILLNSPCAGPTLFMLSGIHTYRALAQRLEGRCSAYGVFAPMECEILDHTRQTYSVTEMAREYVAIVRGHQPAGPYHLLGYSFAGIVAYEVAQQLRALGEEVRFLALVDPILPEWTLGWRYRLAELRRLPAMRARDLLPLLRRAVRRRLGPRDSGLIRFSDDATMGALEAQRDQVNYAAAAEYLPHMRHFSGAVTLIASGVRLRNDPLKSPTGRWSELVTALDIQTIDADHFPILSDEPHVSQLAAILGDRLQRGLV